MAYARLGPNSDVCLLGITTDGENRIRCWGCLFSPSPPGIETADWTDAEMAAWEPEDAFPEFDSKAEVITHLMAHREAGHKVPTGVFSIINLDTWVP